MVQALFDFGFDPLEARNHQIQAFDFYTPPLFNAWQGLSSTMTHFDQQMPLHDISVDPLDFIRQHYIDCFELLLQYGGSLQEPSYRDASLLGAIFNTSNTTTFARQTAAIWLKRHNTDFNVLDEAGLSPLHRMVQHDCLEDAAYLLQMACDPLFKTGPDTPHPDKDAVELAQIYGNGKVIALLEQSVFHLTVGCPSLESPSASHQGGLSKSKSRSL